MKDFLLKKIEILKKAAKDLELFDLGFYEIMLMKPDNISTCIEPYVCAMERRICNRVTRDFHKNFYNKLDKINNDIENYKKSFLADF